MSKISFENFGYIGKKIGFQNSCISSSRYEYQKNYLPKTLSDIINKLSISENDDFLDIGCGLGTFLIPISYLCLNAYGIDHKNFIEEIKKFHKLFDRSKLISGNFLNLKVNKKYDKILVYSVLHYLTNDKEFEYFIIKAIKLLKKRGQILFGDIPILEYEKNFYRSNNGKKFIRQHEQHKKKVNKKNKRFSISDYLNNRNKDNKLVKINLELIRKIKKKVLLRGYKAKIIRHKKNSIFQKTRIDILVSKS